MVVGIDHGHVPFVELDADVALDPGEGVLLADRDQHVVAFDDARRARPVGTSLRRPLASYSALTFSKRTPVSLPFSCVNSLGTRKLRIGMPSCIASSFSQGDAFISSKPRAHDDLHVLAAQAARGAAAIHRRVAAAQHDHALADLVDVAERDARQPVDADMDVGRGFLAAGNVEVAAARRAAADEDRVVAFGEQRLQAVDALAEPQLDAQVEDVAALPRRSRLRAGGSSGSGVRIMPPALASPS